MESRSGTTFLSLKTSSVRKDLPLAATEPEVRVPRSISLVTRPAMVFLPPDSGIRLKQRGRRGTGKDANGKRKGKTGGKESTSVHKAIGGILWNTTN